MHRVNLVMLIECCHYIKQYKTTKVDSKLVEPKIRHRIVVVLLISNLVAGKM